MTRARRSAKVRVRFGEPLDASALRGEDADKEPRAVADALRKAVRELSESGRGKGE
ncbi:MAG: hypothetical protein JJU05_16080 [Verrucomicrobia bacterium]|nr:hypothetical protein [Verrucomicrobiota bacterium]MCH8528890.1 hypothetical protein [Kiritimatiellia bacterium]